LFVTTTSDRFRASTLLAISDLSELARLVATSVARASVVRRPSNRTHPHTAEKQNASKRIGMVSQWCDCAHTWPGVSRARSDLRDHSNLRTWFVTSTLATEFSLPFVSSLSAPVESAGD
jgi:hypothetical protein